MQTLSELCLLIQKNLNLPVYTYKDSMLAEYLPKQDSSTFPPIAYVMDIINALHNTDYLFTLYTTEFTSSFAGFRFNHMDDTYIIVGPISSIPYTETTFFQMYHSYVISKDKNEFANFFNTIPQMTYYEFFRKTILINYILNHTIYPEEEILSYFQILSGKEMISFNNQSWDVKEVYNNSYEIETALCSYVEAGNLKAMQEFMQSTPFCQNGMIADTNLRQEKNTFIATITLVTRAAIHGGISSSVAYQLSDLYIQQVEHSFNSRDIIILYTQAVFDFTNKVAECKYSSSDNLVQKCIEFVRNHTNSNITVQDVADDTGYNRSYVSTKFKQEMGFNLNAFIIRCKLEESLILLKYTNKTISEISNFLYFANQSHFQGHFKKRYGKTPLEFRRENSLSIR